MRSQTELKELLAVYENELVENRFDGRELAALVERIRAQIVEEVEDDGDNEPIA